MKKMVLKDDLISTILFLQSSKSMTLRPNIKEIEKAYSIVLRNWKEIDDQLDKEKVGRKDTPFDQRLMDNLLCAWEYLDFVIRKKDYDLALQEGRAGYAGDKQ